MLRNVYGNTYHFCLTASRETIYDRLRERGEDEGNWCLKQTDKCLKAYNDYNFGEYIEKENISVNAIVNTVREKLNIL